MKKAIVIALISLIAVWSVRIYSINQSPPVTAYYDIGDKVECGGLELSFIESHIDDPDEFEKRFGIDFENECGDYKMISILIDVKNTSDKDISIDDICEKIGYGFESPVWGSAPDIIVQNKVNSFDRYMLPSGETRKIWFLTEINKKCFKVNNWKRAKNYQYLFVFTYVPQKSAVRIKV